MQKRTWKRIALGVLSVFLVGVVVLAVHIWWVMKPRPDATSRVMERIDLHRPIGKAEAGAITAWLYQQKGVDHVLVNPNAAIVIFTFAPLQNDGNRIAADFRHSLAYPSAQRIQPSEEEMASGCPVATTSFAFKAYNFVKHLF